MKKSLLALDLVFACAAFTLSLAVCAQAQTYTDFAVVNSPLLAQRTREKWGTRGSGSQTTNTKWCGMPQAAPLEMRSPHHELLGT
jgi:hypothetical protein